MGNRIATSLRYSARGNRQVTISPLPLTPTATVLLRSSPSTSSRVTKDLRSARWSPTLNLSTTLIIFSLNQRQRVISPSMITSLQYRMRGRDRKGKRLLSGSEMDRRWSETRPDYPGVLWVQGLGLITPPSNAKTSSKVCTRWRTRSLSVIHLSRSRSANIKRAASSTLTNLNILLNNKKNLGNPWISGIILLPQNWGSLNHLGQSMAVLTRISMRVRVSIIWSLQKLRLFQGGWTNQRFSRDLRQSIITLGIWRLEKGDLVVDWLIMFI